MVRLFTISFIFEEEIHSALVSAGEAKDSGPEFRISLLNSAFPHLLKSQKFSFKQGDEDIPIEFFCEKNEAHVLFHSIQAAISNHYNFSEL